MELDLILGTPGADPPPTGGGADPPPTGEHPSLAAFELALDLVFGAIRSSSLSFVLDLDLSLAPPVGQHASSLDAGLDLDLAFGAVRLGDELLAPSVSSMLAFTTSAVGTTSTPDDLPSAVAFDLKLGLGLSPRLERDGVGYFESALAVDLELDLSLAGRAITPPSNPAAATGPSAQGAGVDRTGIELTLTGQYTLEPVGALAFGDVLSKPRLTPRAMRGVSITVPTPVILGGQPCLPAFVIRPSSSATLKGHSKGTDTDPGTGDWLHRWLASDLALTGEYMNSWPGHGGGPAFNSVYPYRPKLRAHQVYGAGAKRHTFSNMVFFNPNYVEHMWFDAGVEIPQPYTWIFVGLVLGYPSARYGHWMLDAGKPTPVFPIGEDHIINDQIGHRSTLSLDRKAALISTSDQISTGNYVRTPHDYAPRPKVYVAEFNGKSSYVAAMDTHSRHIQRGTVNVVPNRHFIVGRRQNRVSDNFASHMALLEIRLYNRSMATAEITAIYKQLASTYRFNKF